MFELFDKIFDLVLAKYEMFFGNLAESEEFEMLMLIEGADVESIEFHEWIAERTAT